ncbi:MAG TPA: CDP-diacylglycerol--glycerol-3-phosphate 3-phosphatidyltransferase [Dissulfurispiraceae bacterium]|nr:CDP-diacylglycerol--glycerol-3-phosphate 3-phosphatidyltransferase [Dissulfurispiraceae bacterium]
MRTATVNIPTVLTVGRIALIPVFVLVTADRPLLGVFLFLIAALTDFFDGYIARRSGQVTKLGIILDPIADKLLVISALVLLVDMVRISAWVAIVIILREFLVTTFRFVALSKGIVMPAEQSGKAKTVFQMVAIILLLLPGRIGPVEFYDAGLVTIYIAAFLAVVSGVKYTISFWRLI